MYSKIINPETGRSVLVNGLLGKNILKKYLSVLGSGRGNQGMENETEDLVKKIIADYNLKITKAITDANLNFENLVIDEYGKMAPKKKEFYKCSAFEECNRKIKELMSQEYSHTGYYLNYLKKCAYSKHKNTSGDYYKPNMKFYFHPYFLLSLPDFNELCNWNEFKSYVQNGSFYIQKIETSAENKIISDTKSNNVFVVGPSAAGKTFSWKTLIPRLPASYPSNYLSIDGGLMRDYSLVYEMVKEIIKKKNYISPVIDTAIKKVIKTTKQFAIKNPLRREKGLYNIHLENGIVSSVGGSKIKVTGESSIDIYDIFQGFKLKNEFNLIIEKSVNNGAKISMVIPDTLTGTLKQDTMCKLNPKNLLRKSFGECIQEYMVDKYNFGRTYSSDYLYPTVFLVYQHKNPISKVPKNIRCEGTMESGNKRSIGEAKPYSSSAWKMSMDLGLKLFEAEDVKKGIRLIIHNSGSPNRESSNFNIIGLSGTSDILGSDIKILREVPKIDILSGMLYTGKLPRRKYLLLSY